MKINEEYIRDGILFGKLYIKNVDVDSARIALKSRLRVADGKSYPTLIDIRSVENFTDEAKTFLASKEASSHITAGGLLVRSVYQRIAGNFFLFINKPPIPARLFTDENAAIEWLSKFISDKEEEEETAYKKAI